MADKNSQGFDDLAKMIAELETFAASDDPQIRALALTMAEKFAGNIATGPSDELVTTIARLRGLAKKQKR